MIYQKVIEQLNLNVNIEYSNVELLFMSKELSKDIYEYMCSSINKFDIFSKGIKYNLDEIISSEYKNKETIKEVKEKLRKYKEYIDNVDISDILNNVKLNDKFIEVCKTGNLEVAKLLLEIPNNNIKFGNYYTFRLSCSNGHLEVAQ